jgi:hypothetical protein
LAGILGILQLRIGLERVKVPHPVSDLTRCVKDKSKTIHSTYM